MLAADAGIPATAPGLGPSDVLGAITNRLTSGRELVVDVSNYVARNSVRTAVQNVLHARLGEAQTQFAGAPIVVVVYDSPWPNGNRTGRPRASYQR